MGTKLLERDFYVVYRVTNNINGNFYIGVHGTDDLEDDYLGSGGSVLDAIAKYGAEHFTREIIKHFESAESAYEYEALIVDEAFVSRRDTYNQVPGGIGMRAGTEAARKWNQQGLQAEKERGLGAWSCEMRDRARQACKDKKRGFFDPELQARLTEFRKSPEQREKRRQSSLAWWATHDNVRLGRRIMHHNGLQLDKEVDAAQVEACLLEGWEFGTLPHSDLYNIKNRNAGRRWMHRGSELRFAKVIEIEHLLEEGWQYGRRGFDPCGARRG